VGGGAGRDSLGETSAHPPLRVDQRADEKGENAQKREKGLKEHSQKSIKHYIKVKKTPSPSVLSSAFESQGGKGDRGPQKKPKDKKKEPGKKKTKLILKHRPLKI